MAKMKFRPLHDRVVVRRLDAEEKTKGGIIIPDTAREKPQEGEIVAVGPGGRDESGKLIPIDVKPGNRVLLEHWGDLADDPAAWAKAAEETGVDLLQITLSLTDAEGNPGDPGIPHSRLLLRHWRASFKE